MWTSNILVLVALVNAASHAARTTLHTRSANSEPIQEDRLKGTFDKSNSKQGIGPEPNKEEFESPVRYDGAQLWKVKIVEKYNLHLISSLEKEGGISVWAVDHSSVHVLVEQNVLQNISAVLGSNSIPFDVVNTDIQRLIDEENPPLDEETILLQKEKGHGMTWLKYHRVKEMYELLDYLGTKYPKICSVKVIGKSVEGLDIKFIKISNGKPGNKALFIDGGIHAREWISPAVVTYFINQIAENFDAESDDIKNIDWYFVPMINPDGYEYSHKTERLWRKNRRKSTDCYGVDLNRNFGFKWGGKGSSNDPCSEVYSGPSAYSEPESKAVSDFILGSTANFSAYLTYHSYGQMVLYPWGYDENVPPPPDHKELEDVGKKMATAIRKLRETHYVVISAGSLPGAGASDDWAKGVANIKYSYTVELSDQGKYGFVLPASEILPVSEESFAGLRALAAAVLRTPGH